MTRPAASYRTLFVTLSRGGQESRVVPETPRFVLGDSELVGWASDSRALFFTLVGPNGTALKRVDRTGASAEILSAPEHLKRPCRFNDPCQAISSDGRYGLFLRSTNLNPGELIRVNLRTGQVRVVARPNRGFAGRFAPVIRAIEIEGTNGAAWGRLYLPAGSQDGRHHPLIFTHYSASPGFATDVGDEVPILALVDVGIAVFDMNSSGFNQVASFPQTGIEAELSRVRRPLEAMRSVTRTLAGQGVIDADRVGIGGLSYGSEIVMYALWNWSSLTAASAGGGSWSPSVYLHGGPAYSRHLDGRGFPSPSDLESWRALSADLNARPDQPPLIIQSADQEQNFTVSTWTEFRRAGAVVEWHEYPNEGHVKASPASRWRVYQRNLDWFRFWLQGYEDPDPRDRDQYTRWRVMRATHCSAFTGIRKPWYCR